MSNIIDVIIVENVYLLSQGTLMQLSVPNPEAAAALIKEKWLCANQFRFIS